MDLASDVADIVGRHLIPPITDRGIPDDVPLAQLGLDSLASVNLLLDLEESLGISFPDDALTPETFRTMAAICAAVSRIRGVSIPGGGAHAHRADS